MIWTAAALLPLSVKQPAATAEDRERSSLTVPMSPGSQQGCIAKSGSRLPQSMAFGEFVCHRYALQY
jgi:hypothetical protein